MDPLSESTSNVKLLATTIDWMIKSVIIKWPKRKNKPQSSGRDSAGWPLDGEDPRGQMCREQESENK